MLSLLAVAELLGMSLWFTGSAVGPQLQERWALSGTSLGWLTTIVQLGFVAGTALSALLNLADLVPSRRLFAAAALAGAAANAGFAQAASFEHALAFRFVTGFCLAGVYPPAMKMAATWFRARRGLAVGTVVAALTIGKATPYLLHALPGVGVAPVVLAASVAATLAATLVWFGYRDGPFPFAPRPFSWGLVASVMRDRRWRLATGGYLGHMAELYAFWTWIPAFLLASAAHRTGVGGTPAQVAPHAASAVTALSFAVIAIALVWGIFVIADSAQFSVLVTESVPPHAVGTALTIQTSLGFLLTTITIQLVPPVVALAGWRWAFPMLAIGPALGIACIRALRVRLPHAAASHV